MFSHSYLWLRVCAFSGNACSEIYPEFIIQQLNVPLSLQTQYIAIIFPRLHVDVCPMSADPSVHSQPPLIQQLFGQWMIGRANIGKPPLVRIMWKRQGWIQVLSKVGVHIRHAITRGVRGYAPLEKINFW